MFGDYAGHSTEPREKLTSRSDVFAIGQVMWNLMAGNPDSMHGPQREHIQLPGKRTCPVADSFASHHRMQAKRGSLFPLWTVFPQGRLYRPYLAWLVADCLEWNAAHRPTLNEIQNRIETYWNTDPHMANDQTLTHWNNPQLDLFRINNYLPPSP